ncbi:MAG: hypothetical protein ABH875_05855 [Candidatus Omnitrophota bacterium]
MSDAKLNLTKSEWVVIYILSAFLFVELLVLMSLVHFAKFPMFIPLFIKTLRLLTPAFLILNAAFIAAIGFVKGKNLIVSSWRDYLSELLRFFSVSLIITISIMTVSALLGALLGLLAERLGEASKAGGLMGALRTWVQQNFY